MTVWRFLPLEPQEEEINRYCFGKCDRGKPKPAWFNDVLGFVCRFRDCPFERESFEAWGGLSIGGRGTRPSRVVVRLLKTAGTGETTPSQPQSTPHSPPDGST